MKSNEKPCSVCANPVNVIGAPFSMYCQKCGHCNYEVVDFGMEVIEDVVNCDKRDLGKIPFREGITKAHLGEHYRHIKQC